MESFFEDFLLLNSILFLIKQRKLSISRIFNFLDSFQRTHTRSIAINTSVPSVLLHSLIMRVVSGSKNNLSLHSFPWLHCLAYLYVTLHSSNVCRVTSGTTCVKISFNSFQYRKKKNSSVLVSHIIVV